MKLFRIVIMGLACTIITIALMVINLQVQAPMNFVIPFLAGGLVSTIIWVLFELTS